MMDLYPCPRLVGNATQAAIRAGYSAKGAEVQGHKLLSNAKVLELAQGHLATRLNRAELTADRILKVSENCARMSRSILYGQLT